MVLRGNKVPVLFDVSCLYKEDFQNCIMPLHYQIVLFLQFDGPLLLKVNEIGKTK